MARAGNDNIEREELAIARNPVLRWLLAVGGFVFIGVGILGMFLPLLPTTVFFILAAWCFARSSAKFHHWLHHNRVFGKYLSNYRSGAGMTVKAKVYSIGFLWLGIIISAVVLTENVYIRILLGAIALGVTYHIYTIKKAED
jgi:uncharacterized protein